MAITINAKQRLDKPRYRPVATQPGVTYIAGSGPAVSGFSCDLRGRDYADPNLFMFASSLSVYQKYNPITDAWMNVPFSTTIGGTGASGTGFQFVPSQGPSGTIAAGATTTSIVLSTALPASVLENQLANRGDKKGYIIRIIDNAVGASGKIEERRIIANTSGTTPTITVDAAFTFTPTSGSRYEFLSGAIYVLSTGASKEWRRHDIATGATSAALATTNLPGTVATAFTDLITLDEQHVPYNRFPGEGFVVGASNYDTGASSAYLKSCLLATNSAAGTLTGQSSAGDASVLSNQFRNFQIRIVEDTAIPTAVGQRRRITSHTAGSSPVYTLASNWTVTPSTTCKFVIENDNDKIIFLTSSTIVYNYNITANTWDTTTWSARGAAPTVGLGSFQSFGIVDSTNVARNSTIFSLRGIGTGGNPVDVLDIAAGATGVWSSFAMTGINTTVITPSTENGAAYDPHSNEGRFMYFIGPFTGSAGPLQTFRLDFKTKTVTPHSPVPTVAGTTTGGVTNHMGIAFLIEGSTKMSFLYLKKPQSTIGEIYELPLLF